ncbi:MAG TPA: hypothetical protein VD837_04355 [Terriglobales bacterium]|nr:hypothetical protein [Terriglobales bacterium]
MRRVVSAVLLTTVLFVITAAQAQMRGGLSGSAGGMRGFSGSGPVGGFGGGFVGPRGTPGVAFHGGFRGPLRSQGGFVRNRGAIGFHKSDRFGFGKSGFGRFDRFGSSFNKFGKGFSRFGRGPFTLCDAFGRCFAQPSFKGFRHRRPGFFFGFGGFPFVDTWSSWPYYGYGTSFYYGAGGLPIYYGAYASDATATDSYLAERERLLSDIETERRRAEQLQDEIAELRSGPPAAPSAPPSATQEQRKDSLPAPTRPSSPTAEPPSPPTTLVLRDSRRVEVKNYAIMGDTLYELGQDGTRKIAISDLDVPATINANEERGVTFRLPGQATKSR